MARSLSGVRADRSQSYANLERLTTSVRQHLEFNTDEAIDALQLFEDLHEICIRRANGDEIPLRSGVIALEDSEGYAHYEHKDGVLEILAAEGTYHRLERRRARAAYFLAHELGHCLLHTDQLIRLAKMPTNQQAAFHRGGGSQHKAYEDTEWQANAFACALLMPAQGLQALERKHGPLTPSLIVERFRVSTQAAGYRLGSFLKRRAQLLRSSI